MKCTNTSACFCFFSCHLDFVQWSSGPEKCTQTVRIFLWSPLYIFRYSKTRTLYCYWFSDPSWTENKISPIKCPSLNLVMFARHWFFVWYGSKFQNTWFINFQYSVSLKISVWTYLSGPIFLLSPREHSVY